MPKAVHLGKTLYLVESYAPLMPTTPLPPNVPLYYEGGAYRTVTAAFQAAKTFNIVDRAAIAKASPMNALLLGRATFMRDDWKTVRRPIMESLLLDMFEAVPERKYLLLSTGDYALNAPINEKYWGHQEQQYAQVLMELRQRYRDIKGRRKKR